MTQESESGPTPLDLVCLDLGGLIRGDGIGPVGLSRVPNLTQRAQALVRGLAKKGFSPEVTLQALLEIVIAEAQGPDDRPNRLIRAAGEFLGIRDERLPDPPVPQHEKPTPYQTRIRRGGSHLRSKSGKPITTRRNAENYIDDAVKELAAEIELFLAEGAAVAARVIDQARQRNLTRADSAASASTGATKRKSKRSTGSSLSLGDMLRMLSTAKHDDPMAQQLLTRLKGALPTDDELSFKRLRYLHMIHLDANKLGATLSAAIQTQRQDQFDPNWQRPPNFVRADALLVVAVFDQLHASFAMLILTQGISWLLDSNEIAEQLRSALKLFYARAPFYPDNKVWLSDLLADSDDVPAAILAVQRAKVMPDFAGSEAAPRWKQFLDTCECDSDENADPECQVHALISACKQYSEAAYRMLAYQLTSLDTPDSP